MAKKTLNTRQKLVFRGPAPSKPRNPLTAAAKQRAAGPHGPTRKGRRLQEKRNLKKLLGES